jgi:hypothetical protein
MLAACRPTGLSALVAHYAALVARKAALVALTQTGVSDSGVIIRIAAGERGSRCLARASNSLARTGKTEEQSVPKCAPQ